MLDFYEAYLCRYFKAGSDGSIPLGSVVELSWLPGDRFVVIWCDSAGTVALAREDSPGLGYECYRKVGLVQGYKHIRVLDEPLMSSEDFVAFAKLVNASGGSPAMVQQNKMRHILDERFYRRYRIGWLKDSDDKTG
jgi:hypothetical protein